MKPKGLIEVAGWLGVLLVLTAYALNIFSVLDSSSVTYQALNALGAIGIIIDGVAKKDAQPVVLNIIWLLIAGVAIISSL